VYAGQGEQDDDPELEENVPAGHGTQLKLVASELDHAV